MYPTRIIYLVVLISLVISTSGTQIHRPRVFRGMSQSSFSLKRCPPCRPGLNCERQRWREDVICVRSAKRDDVPPLGFNNGGNVPNKPTRRIHGEVPDSHHEKGDGQDSQSGSEEVSSHFEQEGEERELDSPLKYLQKLPSIHQLANSMPSFLVSRHLLSIRGEEFEVEYLGWKIRVVVHSDDGITAIHVTTLSREEEYAYLKELVMRLGRRRGGGDIPLSLVSFNSQLAPNEEEQIDLDLLPHQVMSEIGERDFLRVILFVKKKLVEILRTRVDRPGDLLVVMALLPTDRICLRIASTISVDLIVKESFPSVNQAPIRETKPVVNDDGIFPGTRDDPVQKSPALTTLYDDESDEEDSSSDDSDRDNEQEVPSTRTTFRSATRRERSRSTSYKKTGDPSRIHYLIYTDSASTMRHALGSSNPMWEQYGVSPADRKVALERLDQSKRKDGGSKVTKSGRNSGKHGDMENSDQFEAQYVMLTPNVWKSQLQGLGKDELIKMEKMIMSVDAVAEMVVWSFITVLGNALSVFATSVVYLVMALGYTAVSSVRVARDVLQGEMRLEEVFGEGGRVGRIFRILKGMLSVVVRGDS